MPGGNWTCGVVLVFWERMNTTLGLTPSATSAKASLSATSMSEAGLLTAPGWRATAGVTA